MTSSTHLNHTGTRYASTLVQKTAFAIGMVFLLVGVAGFIPGLTSNVDAMNFAGHDSGAMLLGLFQVSILHNIVHLLFGITGVVLAKTARNARNYLLFGGIIYLVLWVYGLVTAGHDTALNFVPLNNADNWLHFFLGAGMIALALLTARRRNHNTAVR